jgi:para-aminobenzoate synthetase/4-amino-4-deoxychorismate lyase
VTPVSGPMTEPGRRPDPARGVFETLLARDGRVQALGAHIARLAGSVADLYGAGLPPRLPERVRSAAAGLTGAHRLRVDARPDDAGLQITVQTSPLADAVPAAVRYRPVFIAGGLGEHKWADRRRLDSLAAPGQVALVVDLGDEALEAAWANLWLVEGRTLITPPADGRLLPGVTRQRLLTLAGTLGLQARAESISLARARAADAIFLTSSLRQAVAAGVESDRPRHDDGSLIPALRAALADSGWD